MDYTELVVSYIKRSGVMNSLGLFQQAIQNSFRTNDELLQALARPKSCSISVQIFMQLSCMVQKMLHFLSNVCSSSMIERLAGDKTKLHIKCKCFCKIYRIKFFKLGWFVFYIGIYSKMFPNYNNNHKLT
ncbi:hypothetical protein C0J52_15783, partial [Blattella germanica]